VYAVSTPARRLPRPRRAALPRVRRRLRPDDRPATDRALHHDTGPVAGV